MPFEASIGLAFSFVNTLSNCYLFHSAAAAVVVVVAVVVDTEHVL